MEQKQTRNQILQKDIMDLLAKISEERSNLIEKLNVDSQSGKSKESTVLSYSYCHMVKPLEKDYNTYKKLVDSLKMLLSTYRYTETTKYKDEDDYLADKVFYYQLNEKLNSEINEVHKLMQDSLQANKTEQYRCLNYAYLKLVEMEERFIAEDSCVDKRFIKAISEVGGYIIECSESIFNSIKNYSDIRHEGYSYYLNKSEIRLDENLKTFRLVDSHYTTMFDYDKKIKETLDKLNTKERGKRREVISIEDLVPKDVLKSINETLAQMNENFKGFFDKFPTPNMPKIQQSKETKEVNNGIFIPNAPNLKAGVILLDIKPSDKKSLSNSVNSDNSVDIVLDVKLPNNFVVGLFTSIEKAQEYVDTELKAIGINNGYVVPINQ